MSKGIRCKWNTCGSYFSNEEELITHIKSIHLVSFGGEGSILRDSFETGKQGPKLAAANPRQSFPNETNPAEPRVDDNRNTEEHSELERAESLKCGWTTCHAAFPSTQELATHLKLHFNTLKRSPLGYQCRWRNCSRKKPHATRYLLAIHARDHTGEKPYRCKFRACVRKFARLESYQRHQRSHTREKPYQCTMLNCEKVFSNPSDRAHHQDRTHLRKKSYNCGFEHCNKSYTEPSSLRKHVTEAHGEDVFLWLKENKGQIYKKRFANVPTCEAPKTSNLAHDTERVNPKLDQLSRSRDNKVLEKDKIESNDTLIWRIYHFVSEDSKGSNDDRIEKSDSNREYLQSVRFKPERSSSLDPHAKSFEKQEQCGGYIGSDPGKCCWEEIMFLDPANFTVTSRIRLVAAPRLLIRPIPFRRTADAKLRTISYLPDFDPENSAFSRVHPRS